MSRGPYLAGGSALGSSATEEEDVLTSRVRLPVLRCVCRIGFCSCRADVEGIRAWESLGESRTASSPETGARSLQRRLTSDLSG
eukprot:scaffold1298_cov257-Pinguiococcus_pyrenoidosus.AAC.7